MDQKNMVDNERANRELKELASSVELREDLRRVAARRRPLDMEEWFAFLLAYNKFAGHPRKPRRPIEGENWKL